MRHLLILFAVLLIAAPVVAQTTTTTTTSTTTTVQNAGCASSNFAGVTCYEADNVAIDLPTTKDLQAAYEAGDLGGTGDVESVWDCLTGACTDFTLSDGDLLDFSSVEPTDATEGLHLPQAFNTCNQTIEEGQVCWDTDGEQLFIGTGAFAQEFLKKATDEVSLVEITDTGTPEVNDYIRVRTGAASIEYRDYTEVKTDLGLVIGTNVQAWDADLDTLATNDGSSLTGVVPVGTFDTLAGWEACAETDSLNIHCVLGPGRYDVGAGLDVTLVNTSASVGSYLVTCQGATLYSTDAFAAGDALVDIEFGELTDWSNLDLMSGCFVEGSSGDTDEIGVILSQAAGTGGSDCSDCTLTIEDLRIGDSYTAGDMITDEIGLMFVRSTLGAGIGHFADTNITNMHINAAQPLLLDSDKTWTFNLTNFTLAGVDGQWCVDMNNMELDSDSGTGDNAKGTVTLSNGYMNDCDGIYNRMKNLVLTNITMDRMGDGGDATAGQALIEHEGESLIATGIIMGVPPDTAGLDYFVEFAPGVGTGTQLRSHIEMIDDAPTSVAGCGWLDTAPTIMETTGTHTANLFSVDSYMVLQGNSPYSGACDPDNAIPWGTNLLADCSVNDVAGYAYIAGEVHHLTGPVTGGDCGYTTVASQIKLDIQAHTGDASLTEADCLPSLLHTNTGAAGTVTLTLPSPTYNSICRFAVVKDEDFIIDVLGASDIIYPLTLSGGDPITSSAPGSSITLSGIQSTVWAAQAITGSWAPMYAARVNAYVGIDYTAAPINAVTVSAAAKVYTRTDGGNFITDGVRVGDTVTWSNFVQGANNGVKTVNKVTATTMRVDEATANEATGGNEIYVLDTHPVDPTFLSGSTLTNESGHAQEIASTLDLPPASAGMKFTFYLTDAVDVHINPDDGDMIIYPGVMSATNGDAISSDATVGTWLTMTAISDAKWVVTGVAGTWTDIN